MAELTTEALNRMVGITADGLAAGNAEAERIAKEQSEKQTQAEAVDKLAMQAEQAIANIPPTYPGRSSLISDIQGAIASARASARSGGNIDLTGLKQLIAKAEETGKETTSRQTSQQYLDGSIVLSQEAQARIEIASRHITAENLREHIDSVVDIEGEMDEQTRKRIVDSMEAGISNSPAAQGQLAIREHFSEHTLRTVGTMQEVGRQQLNTMLAQADTEEKRMAVQRAKNSNMVASPQGLEAISKLQNGEINATEFTEKVIEEEKEKARRAEPYRHEIYNAIPADRRAVLAKMGLGKDADSFDLEAVLHRNGAITEGRAADYQMLNQYRAQGKGFSDLPQDTQERLAVMEGAKHTLLYSGLSEVNDLALFVVQSKDRSQLTEKEQHLIDSYNRLTNPATPAEEREKIAIDLYKSKNPEFFKSVENNPVFQDKAVKAILKTFDENRDKFGIKDNPHLVALEQAASNDVTARFMASMGAGMDAMWAGDQKAASKAADDASTDLAEKAKETLGLSDESAQTVKTVTHNVLDTLGTAAAATSQTLTSLFSSDPALHAEIQQQLAGMETELSALKDAQGNALAIKDTDGKIDMEKVTQALKAKGISLQEVDKDKSGDITGQELLTALAKPKQQGEQQAIS